MLIKLSYDNDTSKTVEGTILNKMFRFEENSSLRTDIKSSAINCVCCQAHILTHYSASTSIKLHNGFWQQVIVCTVLLLVL